MSSQDTTGKFGPDANIISTPPNYTLKFPLTGEQWLKIDKRLDQLLNQKKQRYNFYDHNCSTLQRDTLKEARIDVQSKWNPRSWVPVEVGGSESFMY